MYGLGNAITAVMKVTANTSVMGYFPSMEPLRNLHHLMLALIKAAPNIPYGDRKQNINAHTVCHIFVITFRGR